MENSSFWQGQILRLRAIVADDWRYFHEFDADTEVARLTYEIPPPRSPEGTQRYVAEQSALVPRNHEFHWVVENLAGEFVGTINTHTCEPRNGTFRYGVAILRQHWRKGYASEAIRIVLRYFFGELRYQKVNVDVYDFNEPSLRLHLALGFCEEGRLRRMIYTGGRYHDDVILGLTAEEFEAGERSRAGA